MVVPDTVPTTASEVRGFALSLSIRATNVVSFILHALTSPPDPYPTRETALHHVMVSPDIVPARAYISLSVVLS